MRKTAFLVLAVFSLACSGGQDERRPGAFSHIRNFDSKETSLRVILKLPAKEIAQNQPFDFVILIQFGDDVEDRFDYLPSDFFKPLELSGKPTNRLIYIGEGPRKWAREFSYRMEGVLRGDAEIPPFYVDFRLTGEKPETAFEEWKTHRLRTERMLIRILSSADENAEDLVPGPGAVKNRPYPIPVSIGSGIALACLILAWALLRYRRKMNLEKQSEAVVVDHWEVTFKKLSGLERFDLSDPAQVEKFHVTLSTVLRAFIENYLNEKAEELTTEEFVQNLLGNPRFSSTQQELLRDYMRLSDSVKFAKFHPGRQVNLGVLEKVLDFVKASKKQDNH